jgi:uncharacterized protein (UPF0335 family)
MPQNDELLVKVAEAQLALDKRVEQLEETLKSLSKWLTHAFREMGYDFQKIAMIESSRRKDEIRNQTDVVLTSDEIDPEVQNELALRILKNEPSQDGDVCPI